MKRTAIAALGTFVAVTAVGCSADEKPAEPTKTTTVTATASPSKTTTATSTTTVTTSASPTTTSSSATPTSTSPMVGGMTECTKEALAQPATMSAQALGPNNLYTIDTLSCADGWAVTTGLLSSKDNPGMGAPTSFIYEQQGQFWIPKEKAQVCGTNPVTTTPPADAEIPADLFVVGCAAG